MDVAAWLRELGLERYDQAFQDNEVDERSLPHLTAEDLKEMGVTAIGHRRLLLRSIADLREIRTSAGEAASERVASREGVTSIGHRRRILAAIARAHAAERAEASTRASHDDRGPPRREPTRPAQAERRQLTVLFCDLVGSTELSGQLDPEDMGRLIGTYQACCAEVIKHWKGHVAKFMGDGILAYFGYPRAHEDDPERSVRAGLSLTAKVANLKVEDGAPLAARVGIATGLVMVGELIGEGSAQEQTVVGETPNLAARLQGLAAPGQVVIAPTTRRLVDGLFELEDLGAHELKGIALPVEIAGVVGESTAESRFEARQGLRLTPLIGREQEIALLLDRFERARGGDGQVVLLSGEPGIGKSRIIQALRARLAGQPYTSLVQYCSPYHINSALHPVIGLLRRVARLDRADPPHVELAKLEALLARGTGRLDETVPLLADLLGIAADERWPGPNYSPQRKAQRTLEVLVELVEGLAATQPVLAVYEDVHWIDPTTLEALGLLIERAQSLQVLVLVSCRPEFDPPWTGHSHVSQLSLTRLARRDGSAMVAGVTEGKALPAEVLEQIVARTDGVPLFVEELTKTVLESGLLRDAGDHFALDGSLPPLAIPTTLHDSLMARLDHLAPAKEVAQIGAVIGREFGHTILAAVADRADADLGAALDQLVEAELILRHRSPPEATYSFKHALVRDAAYESLLKSRRQVLHDRICVVLEQDFPETAPEVLGAHASSAGRIDAAIGYWEQAGRAAYERAAHKEAIAHYRGALDLLAQLPDTSVRRRMETGLLIGLGAPTGSLVGFGAAETEEVYRQALAVCDREPNPGAAAAALGALCFAQHCRGDERVAKETAERELAEAERDGEWATLQAAYSDLGDSLLMLGEFSAAAETLGRISEDQGDAIEAAAEVAGRDALVQAASIRAVALWHLGMPDTALSTIGAAVVRGSRSPRPLDQIFPVSFAAKIHLLRREYVEARQHAKRVVQLGKETGVVHFLYDGLVWLGWALVGLDEIDDGLDAIRRGIDGRRTIESFVAWPLFLLIQAYALSRGGQSESALDTLDEAIQWTERGGDRHWLAEIHRQRGTMALMHERSNIDPEAEMRRALDVARGQEARSQELRAATSLARLWAEQGERRKAHNLLAPIHDRFTEGFDTADLEDAKALLDELA